MRARPGGPGDGDVVDVVFAGLSPRSRYLRFQGPVAELSAATRRSLTALDSRTHVALAAFAQGRPIGIVRIIDLGDGRGELAVEVVDRWQGCGVGTQLQAARARAAAMGYRELVGEMLVVNAAALAAVRRVFRLTRVRRDGSKLTITMVVDGRRRRARWRGSSRRKTHRPVRRNRAVNSAALLRVNRPAEVPMVAVTALSDLGNNHHTIRLNLDPPPGALEFFDDPVHAPDCPLRSPSLSPTARRLRSRFAVAGVGSVPCASVTGQRR